MPFELRKVQRGFESGDAADRRHPVLPALPSGASEPDLPCDAKDVLDELIRMSSIEEQKITFKCL